MVFLAAGFVQGLTGFGSALVAIPLLSLFMDVKRAVPLCILNGLAITTYLAIQLRRDLDPARIRPLLLGALPGILVGATMLKTMDSTFIRCGIGLLLVSYSLYSLFFHPGPLYPGRGWAWLAGFLTGAIGAAFSAGGPPAIIYTTLSGWRKNEIKATLTGLFAINSGLIAVVHALTGVTTRATVAEFGLTLPFVLAGTALGSLVTARIDRTTYIRVIHILLTIMGLMLLA